MDNEVIYTYDTLNQVPKSKDGDWYEEFEYEARGYLIFAFDKEGLISILYDRDYYINLFTLRKIGINKEEIEENVQWQIFEDKLTDTIYHKMDGLDFLQAVRRGSFIDYDGTLCDIYVDGYKSNLGLEEEGIHQGDFKVTGKAFEELCNSHDIWVNWANR